MVEKGIVANKQEAFDKYLAKCNVPKMPLSLSEASTLIRGAGGKLMMAHPNDPNGTSLVFAKEKGLMVTGGSDCHQQPVIMGTVPVPIYVVDQFGIDHHDLESSRKER